VVAATGKERARTGRPEGSGAPTSTEPPGPAAAALDVLLTEAAVGGPPRFVPIGSAAKAAAAIARRPARTVRRTAGLAGELGQIAVGGSELAPERRDRRFADPAWRSNWLFRRLMQSYLAAVGTVDGLIDDAELDWRADRQARFAAQNVLDALAPTNFPWSNPTVLKELVDQGGANLVRGARRLARDVSRPPRLPASVDVTKFEVGGNLAATPGAVVLRNEVLELIQYAPRTETVRTLPLMLVPPTINKYYIVDLSPGRSIVEWLVGQGQQLFTISWRNPDVEQGHFDLDTYVEAVADAREAVAEITGQEGVHALGACSGGMITAAMLGSLAAAGRLPEFASLTLMVCVLDNARAGTAAALGSQDLAAAAVAESARKGYLDGRALAEIFAWLRPNDLIWSYWVNNYLLGKDPPAFDILFWNQDTVRMTAGLHRDFIKIALENPLTLPGRLEVLGRPVDLSAVDLPAYVVAGLNDHIVPWENAYRTTQLLGGPTRFVLSTSGHIQAIVNPPSPESRSSYRTADENPPSAEEFMALADKQSGSWWPDYDRWLAERSGELRPAPAMLGSRRHKASAKAPGSYVHAH
jgi:polyhydroxyalkanoate synthase subunit PhaC